MNHSCLNRNLSAVRAKAMELLEELDVSIIIKTKDPRGAGSKIQGLEKINKSFLPGLDINWNGILEFPTFIWYNNKYKKNI